MSTPDLSPSEKELKLHVLLTQYSQNWEDRRFYTQMIWQTPTISLAIVGVLISGLIAGRIHNSMIQGGVFLASSFILWIGTIQLKKHRFLQFARNCDFEAIQKDIRNLDECLNSIRTIKFKTDAILCDKDNYPDVPRSWLDKESAFDWLFYPLLVLTLASCIIGIATLSHIVHF